MARPSDREMRAWQAFLHAHHEVVARLDADLRQSHGLTFAEYDVLLRLARAPGRALRMSDIAARVLLSPSGITRLVERLVERDLIVRDADPADGRAVLATLTERGLTVIRSAARTHVAGIREHFSSRLSDDELDAVARALERIVGPHESH